MSNLTRSLLIAIVTCVWALNFTAPIFVKDYKPAPELNVAFMAILGILTGTFKRGNDKDGDDKDNHDDESNRKEVNR